MAALSFSADRLRAHRLDAGLSREALAVAAGRSFNSVQLYETGKRVPNANSLAALASALGITINDLFEAVER